MIISNALRQRLSYQPEFKKKTDPQTLDGGGTGHIGEDIIIQDKEIIKTQKKQT